MTAYPLAFQPLLANGQLAFRRQHPRGEHRFGQKQIRQKPPAIPKQLPHRGSNCRSRVQKSKESTHRRPKCPHRRSKIKFPYPSATQR